MPAQVTLPPAIAPFAHCFPTAGYALDLASGRGLTSIWLARRGMTVTGVDVSPVAINDARALAQQCGVADRCHFDVFDLDDGLPPGPVANVIVCQLFRDSRLDQAVMARLAPGGLLAISALSEVGAAPGRFRAPAGELTRAFGPLDVIAAEEAHGVAWLLGTSPRLT